MSAEATLDQTKAKLVQTEAEWKRATALIQEKLMAQVDFDTDQANYEVAKADVAVSEAGIAQARAATVQAQAALEGAQRNLDFSIIKSPVKGVIIDRRVNVGQTVVASLNAPSLFLIAKDLTRMQIWVAVNEADVGRITPGGPVTFTSDAFPGRRFDGVVGKVRLNATMTQNVVMYTVEVNTENKDKVLLPYLTATNVWLVPNAALRWSPSSLMEIAPDDRAKMQAGPPDDASSARNSAGANGRPGTLCVREGDFVRPVTVKAGVTDEVDTPWRPRLCRGARRW